MSTITLALSSFPTIVRYLEDRTIDLSPLTGDVTAKTNQLNDLEAALRAARAKAESVRTAYNQAEAAHAAARDDKKAAFYAAQNELLRDWRFGHTPTAGLYPRCASSDMDEEAKESYARVMKLGRELEQTPRHCSAAAPLPLEREVESVASKVASLRLLLQASEDKFQKAKAQMEGAKAPEGLECLSDKALGKLLEIDVDELQVEPEPEFESHAELAGYIRAELPVRCPCSKGFVTVNVKMESHDLRLLLDDEPRHNVCRHRALFHPAALEGAVPEKHAHHRMHDLKPWPRSPLSIPDQQKMIEQVPSFLRG